ncbi:MAG: metallophosphoesterase [Candidatus Thiodiazotropha sp. (ex Epidulcina cf. delphinae)]|nr:metallophosphoesterase [Candidatus Thiodiazotropha sp. (ex Epidulcina cf. delphinae)]
MTDLRLHNIGPVDGSILIFGGPYGNLQATQAIRQVSERLGIPPSRVFCNGDCAAYCAQPEETVQLIREWGIAVVMGNCEQSLAEQRADCGCGFSEGSGCSLLADEWYRFCEGRLSNASKAWMGALPTGIAFALQGIGFQLVHGALSAINRFVFASTPVAVKQEELAKTDADVVIGGHAGLPFGERLDDRYWLNSGVIGMPANDGTQDGWYLQLLPQAGGVRCEWHRLNYDAKAAQAAMREAGRFNGYAQTLLSGLWPSMDILPDHELNRQGRALLPRSITIPS